MWINRDEYYDLTRECNDLRLRLDGSLIKHDNSFECMMALEILEEIREKRLEPLFIKKINIKDILEKHGLVVRYRNENDEAIKDAEHKYELLRYVIRDVLDEKTAKAVFNTEELYRRKGY